MRPRAPEPLPVQLNRHRIYILPTATGWFFATLLAVMLLGALNFNNNPALLLALLLAGTALASLIGAHLQLSGLRLSAVAAEPVAAGEALRLRIALDTTDTRQRHGLRIAYAGQATHTALDAHGITVELALPTQRRGLLPVPKLELSTVQPLGLARAWAYAWPTHTLLVYPAAETLAPPLPIPVGHGHPQPARSGDDPHLLREYRPGDAPRMVAWKASARHATLLVRDAEQQRGDELLLDWQLTAGLAYEQRIRRLARWVDDAERAGHRYSLQLPGTPVIAADTGSTHRHRCLRALALLPSESPRG